jgi:hypothetical protein
LGFVVSKVVIRICAAGLVVIGVGAHIQIAAAHYLDFLADTYLNTPIFIIIAGQSARTHSHKAI